MKHLILLCGRKRTGKGLASKIFKKKLHSVEEFFFAKPIKDFCINVLGLRHEQVYGETSERESPTQYQWGGIAEDIRFKYNKQPNEYLTARQVLQVVGSDFFREKFYKNVWAEAGVRQVQSSNKIVSIFNDVRYLNEIQASTNYCSSNGLPKPLVIRLYRDTDMVDDHASETALDEYDFHPAQRHLEIGNTPDGFYRIHEGLWIRENNHNHPFDYLIDNNYDQSILEKNLSTIIQWQMLPKRKVFGRIKDFITG
jgi:hypothetical protein